METATWPVIPRQADVYVFALLDQKIKCQVNPLDLTQWKFYAVPTACLNERART